MATPTEDLVLRVLRDIQGTLAEHGRKLDEHTREFERLRSDQHEIRESIVTALGLSAHANVRNDLMKTCSAILRTGSADLTNWRRA